MPILLSTLKAFLHSTLRPTTVQGHLIRAFLALIAIGTGVLSLPQCQSRPVPFIDCLFTAASAVCVTGLTTVDFAATFNVWGQAATLVLNQLGGLGVITFAALAFHIVGAHLSLTTHAMLADSMMQKDAAAGFRELFFRILSLLLGMEAVGAILLWLDRWLLHATPPGEALWQGVFHAVSGFCNSGFTLWPDSLLSQDRFFCLVIAALIFFGGTGQVAVSEIAGWAASLWRRFRGREGAFRFSYNTRVTLVISFAMIALGLLSLFIDCWHAGRLRDFDVVSAVSQAVSTRTAGFTIYHNETMSRRDTLVAIFMMFIGGSPGSCAGGIKTTGLAIMLAAFIATVRNREDFTFMGRQIPSVIVSRARKVIFFTLFWNILGIFILCHTEANADLLTIMFEQVSAFGTVGLSLDFTPQLSHYGKLWICLSMFFGRMGPLTIALGIAPLRPAKYSHPEGQIMIG